MDAVQRRISPVIIDNTNTQVWEMCPYVDIVSSYVIEGGVRVMVFNTTFKNISVISWWSVLLVEETGVPRENHWPSTSHWQTLSHNVVLSTPCHEWDSNAEH